MDWVLNHIFIVVFVTIAVANVLQQARKAGPQKRLPQRPPQPARDSLDPDAAERTRRVQEEIRRKIAERAGRRPAGPPPVPQSPVAGPATAPPARNIFQELARQMAEAKKIAEARERAPAATEAPVQRRAEDERKSREPAEAQRLAEVQSARPAQQPTVTAAAYRATDLKTTDANARDKLLASLREPDSLRRAWVLREILGEPVGLR
jgi:hypothetical protein